jgi:bifunctional non-homologous end joining protein LigD
VYAREDGILLSGDRNMLEEYDRKRDFKKTAEPKGRAGKAQKGAPDKELVFVVQKHDASHLHYDFRLEVGGVLVSWAVPKGPCLDPHVKRLAMKVEDHPYDYKDFEGIIPKGEYGGGEVIVWDRGSYKPIDADEVVSKKEEAEKVMREGLKRGKLSLMIYGEKLHGSWTIFRLKDAKQWLLAKHQDQFANTEEVITDDDRSVITGHTIEDLKAMNGDSVKVWHSRAKKEAKTVASAIVKKTPAKVEKVKIAKNDYPLLPDTKPMLADLAKEAFDRKGWIFEPKLDGYRAIGLIANHQARLLSRASNDISDEFPKVIERLEKLNGAYILDGEIVALDSEGKASFQLLQRRFGFRAPRQSEKEKAQIKIVYYVFDILFQDGVSLINEPLRKRKEILNKIRFGQPVEIINGLDLDGKAAFKRCIDQGFEGIVAKNPESRYEPGRRSASWLKVKGVTTSEFVICGYTKGEGGRSKSFGALVLGFYEQGKLRYSGRVGTGFDEGKLQNLLKAMQPLKSDKNPFPDKIPIKSGVIWLKPNLVAEIKYAEMTLDKILRAPVFMRLRDDILARNAGPPKIIDVKATAKESTSESKGKSKSMSETKETKSKSKNAAPPKVEVKAPTGEPRKKKAELAGVDEDVLRQLENPAKTINLNVEGRTIPLSNLDKVLWPGSENAKEATKRDYLLYLAKVAPFILPHLKNRPLTLKRFPSGVTGQAFFQKHWDSKAPEFLETVDYYSEHAGGDEKFLLCSNLPSLLWLAQIADLELHVMNASIDPGKDGKKLTTKFTGSLKNIEGSLLNYPDYLVFDLDPYIYRSGQSMKIEPELNTKGFEKTRDIALSLKELLDNFGIDSFVKTSGKTGLHIYVPVIRSLNYDALREIAENVGKHLMSEHPNDITMEWSVSKRTDKIFFDHKMNGRGKTLAGPYSPRNSLEASVSTPIDWSEVPDVYPSDFTIFTVPERLHKKGDPWQDILSHRNDLVSIFKTKS